MHYLLFYDVVDDYLERRVPLRAEHLRLAQEAREVYERALEAQRAGDWAKYGEEIKRLGEILEKMRP